MGTLARAAVIAVVVLAAAGCSDDDDAGGFPAALAERAGEAAGEQAGDGICRLVTPTELADATGLAFRPGTAGDGTCTYVADDAPATLVVNLTDLPADAELALETTAASCDEGSVTTADDVPGTTGAFVCLVSGVQVAAGTSPDAYAVITGTGLPGSDGDGGPGGRLLAVLSLVLGRA